MDLSDPTRSVVATLDGAVLAALAVAGRPLTVGDVAAAAARGSEIGVRRSLARLVEQGIVRATVMGRNQVHELNREHIAADVAVALADLRNRLWSRFRTEISAWRVQPVHASVFGSAARGDGDESSDIDLLLVRPPYPGEALPNMGDRGLAALIGDALVRTATMTTEVHAGKTWESQLDQLRDKVFAWTGNSLQIVELTVVEWWRPADSVRRLLDAVLTDGVDVARSRWPRPSTGEEPHA